MTSLKFISILLGPSAPDFRTRQFQDSVRHIEKLFSHHFGSSGKYVLDGKVEVCIFMGPRESAPGYINTPRTHLSFIDTAAFNLDKFLALKPELRDEFTTDRVEKALLKIAKSSGADPKPIKAAAKAIRDAGFAGFLPWPGEQKPHAKKELVAQTGYYHHGNGRAKTRVQLCDLQGHLITVADVPALVADKNPFYNGFKTSNWRDSTFRFCTASNRSLYEVDFSEFVEVAPDRSKGNSKGPAPKKIVRTTQRAAKKSPDTQAISPSLNKALEKAFKSSEVPSLKELSKLMGPQWMKSAEGKAVCKELESLRSIMEAEGDDGSNDILGKVTINRKSKAAKDLGEQCPDVAKLEKFGIAFLKLIAGGDSEKAYEMLSAESRKQLKMPQFLKRVVAFYRGADPKYNHGVTLKKAQPYFYVNVEDPDIAQEFATEHRGKGLKTPILAALELGCEVISREALLVFIVKESNKLKLELPR
jgi:hypothetical protein